MLYAVVNDEKVEAKPNTTGICQSCKQPVFSKCGEINIWHWAHYTGKSCDDWYEPETEWHKNWKVVFGKENCEIPISKEEIRHIADVRTKEDVIIELQNSNIQAPVIRERETFYGERMLWVINGKHFKDNFKIFSYGISEDEEYFRTHNPLAGKSGTVGNYTRIDNFTWTWARKSWRDVKRDVFIDFGDETLFWVKLGMGTSNGRGHQIIKADFLKKYGGNIELLGILIDNSK